MCGSSSGRSQAKEESPTKEKTSLLFKNNQNIAIVQVSGGPDLITFGDFGARRVAWAGCCIGSDGERDSADANGALSRYVLSAEGHFVAIGGVCLQRVVLTHTAIAISCRLAEKLGLLCGALCLRNGGICTVSWLMFCQFIGFHSVRRGMWFHVPCVGAGIIWNEIISCRLSLGCAWVLRLGSWIVLLIFGCSAVLVTRLFLGFCGLSSSRRQIERVRKLPVERSSTRTPVGGYFRRHGIHHGAGLPSLSAFWPSNWCSSATSLSRVVSCWRNASTSSLSTSISCLTASLGSPCGDSGVSWSSRVIIHLNPPELASFLPCRVPVATLCRTVFSLIPNSWAACGMVNSDMLGSLRVDPRVSQGYRVYSGGLGWLVGCPRASLAYLVAFYRVLGVLCADRVQFGGRRWT